MNILDGKKSNTEIATKLKSHIAAFSSTPCMVIIQVGDNPASNVYIRRKIVYATSIGAQAVLKKFDDTITEAALIGEIQQINNDASVHGVIVQLPIPAHINFSAIVNSIASEKDIDGLGAVNMYKLMTRDASGLVPATARGVVTLLEHNNVDLKGARVVVVGRSMLVGKSTALHILNQDATVTICHSKTRNLADYTKTADIIVVATGHPGTLTDEHIVPGQVVVDVGISVVDGVIKGDTALQNIDMLRAFSPVPGGVGPMTVASLFENLVKTYQMQSASKKV
jgi:methylenetetrahydrofolate dehydrogenase (NADP+) / methenyltetrahydrofolate cyclohydrolase